MIKQSLALCLVALCGVGLASCGGEEAPETIAEMSVLRVGVVPDEVQEEIQRKYGPLLDVLSSELGVPTELYRAESYQDLVDVFAEGGLDIAHFGGYTFALAKEQVGAFPLVHRDLDKRFISFFVALAADADKELKDFQGKRIAFVSQLSTSGYLMPAAFLQDQGIEVKKFFSETSFEGSHDLAVYAVRDGKADLGALNAQIFESMIADGRISRDEVRVVAETPPYANYVWAAHPSVGEARRIQIRDAFLSLTLNVEAHRAILDSFGARTFLPANDADYERIRKAIRNMKDE